MGSGPVLSSLLLLAIWVTRRTFSFQISHVSNQGCTGREESRDVVKSFHTTPLFVVPLEDLENDESESSSKRYKGRSGFQALWKTLTSRLRKGNSTSASTTFENNVSKPESRSYNVQPGIQALWKTLKLRRGRNETANSSETGDSLVNNELKLGGKEKRSFFRAPVGDRWAISAPDVDLSGNWTIIGTEEFRKEYDEYLKRLKQPTLVRSVALTIIPTPLTTETTQQTNHGRELFIRSDFARGFWERTLRASGTDVANKSYLPLKTDLVTMDGEMVESESWWAEQGTVHRSWTYNLTKYGGGDSESARYLDEDGAVLVCDSAFHPHDPNREVATVTWRFLKNGESRKKENLDEESFQEESVDS